jgi:hypothetical protein
MAEVQYMRQNYKEGNTGRYVQAYGNVKREEYR